MNGEVKDFVLELENRTKASLVSDFPMVKKEKGKNCVNWKGYIMVRERLL